MWTLVDRGRGGQKLDFCGRHKWMTPKDRREHDKFEFNISSALTLTNGRYKGGLGI